MKNEYGLALQPAILMRINVNTDHPWALRLPHEGREDHMRQCQIIGAHSIPVLQTCSPEIAAKRLHNYGESQFSMGKSTISMGIFNSFMLVITGGKCLSDSPWNGDVATWLFVHLDWLKEVSHSTSWCQMHANRLQIETQVKSQNQSLGLCMCLFICI